MNEEKREVPKEFFDVVDQFIQLANKLAKEFSSSRISSTLLYAAARYNAFNFYALDSDIEEKEDAVEYYCEQYKKMLLDNFDELSETYSSQEMNSPKDGA